MDTITLWFWSFLLTLLIELPVFVLFVKNIVPFRRSLLAGMAGTFFTHPLLWFVWPLVVFENYALYFISGEILVAVIECFTFYAVARPVSFRRSFSASISANAISAIFGLLLFWLTDLL